jgi:NADPH2:quinone reductase
MRALVMTGPAQGSELTRVEDVPQPRPAAGQVGIEVSHAGVNFIDVMARRGDPGYVPAWPYVPGLEVAGTIRELGDGVTGLAVGQRVAAFTHGGGLAGVAVAEASLTVPLPDAVASPLAAAAPLMLSTALLLLADAARFRPGESVLMHSAGGGVGAAVAQLVPVLGGGPRIGVVGRADKVAQARAAGWDSVVVRGDDLVARAREAAGGRVDVILDPSGTRMLDADLELAAPGARIVLFGNADGGQPAPLPALGRLIGGNVSLVGFSINRLTATAPLRVTAALRRAVALLADGALTLPVTEIGSLDEVAAVHQLLADGRGSGKYVARVMPRS